MKKNRQNLHGWLNLHKPVGMGATQAVGKAKRLFSAAKAGHAGTLDPLADGVLPIAFGAATRTVPYLQDRKKTYRFTVQWGEQRDSDDAQGQIIQTSDKRPAASEIAALLPGFIGDIHQTPPDFSAIKQQGKRAYALARQGEKPQLRPRPVWIEDIALVAHEGDNTVFEARTGKGVYIRSLARDFGIKLGCYGYITKLTRLAVGNFHIDDAVTFSEIEALTSDEQKRRYVTSLMRALDDIPVLAIDETQAYRIRQGQNLPWQEWWPLWSATREGPVTETLLLCCGGTPIALARLAGAHLQAERVFVLS